MQRKPLSLTMFEKLKYYEPKLQRKSRKKNILSPGQWVSASSRTGQPKPKMVLKHHVFQALAS
jgi:hypothetical protein